MSGGVLFVVALAGQRGKLDGGSRRRDEVVYGSVLFDSVQFTSVLAGQRGKLDGG